jgi:hypothetical protein
MYTFTLSLTSALDGGERSDLHPGHSTPGNNYIENYTLDWVGFGASL